MKNLKEIYFYTVALLISAVSGILWVPLLTRLLSTNDFASYSYFYQIYIFSVSILQIGVLYTITSKEPIKDYDKHIDRLNKIISLFISFTCYFFFEISLYGVILMCFLLTLTAKYQNSVILFNLLNLSKAYSRYQNGFSLFKVIFALLVILIFDHFTAPFLGMAIAFLVLNLLLRKDNTIKINPLRSIRKSPQPVKEILAISLPLVFFGTLVSAINMIDFYFLKIEQFADKLAIYNGNLTLILSIFSIPLSVITLMLTPRYKTDNIENNVTKFKFVVKGLLLSFGLYVVSFFLFQDLIYSTLLPGNYRLSFNYIFCILIFAFLVNLLNQSFFFLQMNNFKKFKQMLWSLSVLILLKTIIAVLVSTTILNLLITNIVLLLLINVLLMFAIQDSTKKAPVTPYQGLQTGN